MMNDRDAGIIVAAHAVSRAVTEEGAYPPRHRDQMTRLKREWPTLHSALAELTKAIGADE